MNIAKFLRTPILKNICERLLLKIDVVCDSDLTEARFRPDKTSNMEPLREIVKGF